jgi:aminoglycoside 2'-N-acetyltransferase I
LTEIRLAHTTELDAETREAARALLYAVFDDMTEHDWEHCLGGLHALGWEDSELVGHASVIQRRLLHGGRALRTGYIEGVAVRADARRRGLAGRLMDELERVVRGAYDVGALGATDMAADFYRGRGWIPWRGPTSALTPAGIVRTADEDGYIYVLPAVAELDFDGELTCDWRDGDAW